MIATRSGSASIDIVSHSPLCVGNPTSNQVVDLSDAVQEASMITARQRVTVASVRVRYLWIADCKARRIVG